MVTDQETGGDGYAILPVAGCLRPGAGTGDPDRGDLSDRMPPVPCGNSADRLRLGLHAQVEEGGSYEDRRCQVPEVFERDLEKDL